MRSRSALARPPDSGTQRPAQTRVIETALVLFAEHGISGTSLQMIADAIGVTKAAVYHQYQTKDSIVLAVAGVVLASLEAAVLAAAIAGAVIHPLVLDLDDESLRSQLLKQMRKLLSLR